MNNYSNYNDYYNMMNMSSIQNNQNNQNNKLNQSNFQANNNYNFNKCTYDQVNVQNLYDAYAGFIRGNMFPDLYNEYKVTKPFNIEPLNEQAEMLTSIDALCFASHDLNLYLDNFPDDRKMIELFNQYRVQANKMVEEYEKKFGPIFVNSDATNTYPWSWDNRPWPWENN